MELNDECKTRHIRSDITSNFNHTWVYFQMIDQYFLKMHYIQQLSIFCCLTVWKSLSKIYLANTFQCAALYFQHVWTGFMCVKEEMLTNVGEKLMKDFAAFSQTSYYFISLVFCARFREYQSQYGAVDVTNISGVFVQWWNTSQSE